MIGLFHLIKYMNSGIIKVNEIVFYGFRELYNWR